jgi:hypothetical protein
MALGLDIRSRSGGVLPVLYGIGLTTASRVGLAASVGLDRASCDALTLSVFDGTALDFAAWIWRMSVACNVSRGGSGCCCVPAGHARPAWPRPVEFGRCGGGWVRRRSARVTRCCWSIPVRLVGSGCVRVRSTVRPGCRCDGASIRCVVATSRRRWPCRKPRPRRSRGILVLVEDAAEALASSYVEVGHLVRIGDLSRQRVQRTGVRYALMGRWEL